jgi:hypothetical protein
MTLEQTLQNVIEESKYLLEEPIDSTLFTVAILQKGSDW